MDASVESTQTNEDKGLEKLMDEYLKANGLFRRKIAKDGSCLFRAVAEQVLHCQGLHTKVRAACVNYLRKERSSYESFIEGDFEEYLHRLQDPQSWVGQVEITALSVLYKRDFVIYQPGETPVNITENGYPDKVQLCFLNGNHYDSVYPLSYTTNAAVCQSILYELLYDRVFHVDRNVLTASMRGSKVRDEATVAEESKSSDDSDLDNGEDFWSSEVISRPSGVNRRAPYKGRGRGQTRGGGRGYLPPKVQDSLNPSYFRNVEYAVWLRSKKAQQRRDFCMAAGMHYTAGDKCQVRLRNDGRYYSAYIQDVSPDDGPVTVFIEELGEKHTLPLWNLRTSEESWCTVTDNGKRHSASNVNTPTNEWGARSERKPVRSVSVTHTPQATTGSAPGNRVQKQNSWPPQAATEARPLGRNSSSRKPDQDVCVLSHLEEEEHALLELLHKDENNFPTLEASAQAACSEGGRRAERKGLRKKADAEMKEPSLRGDRGNHGKKSSVDQDQKICSPLRDKPSLSSPLLPTPPSVVSPKATKPAPGIPVTTPASTQSTPAHPTPVPSAALTPSVQTTPTQRQMSPLVAKTTSPVQSEIDTATPAAPTTVSPNTSTQTRAACRVSAVPTPPNSVTPDPSHTDTLSQVSSTTALAAAPEITTVPDPSPPLSAPVTPTPNPVFTAAIPHTVSVPPSLTTHDPDTTQSSALAALPGCGPSQTAPGDTLVPTHATAEPRSVCSQTAPGPTTATPRAPLTLPVGTASHTPDHPAHSSVPSSTGAVHAQPSNHSTAPTLPSPVYATHSTTPPALLNVPSAQPPSSITPFHPVGVGAFPSMHLFPSYPPPVPPPASGAMPTPPPVMMSAQTPPYSHPPEPRPYDPATSLITGVGPAPVPEYRAHAPAPSFQHAFPLPNLLGNDPLYPGFPQNDADDAVNVPPFSLQRSGKDLPKDMNVLRWFFNLGVKAYTHQMWPPYMYLTPLTQAYHMQPKAPPPTSALYTPTWHPDQNPHSSPGPNHTPVGPPLGAGGGPIGHFEVRGVTPGPPPVEVGGYSGQPHSVAMLMPPRPPVSWSAPHSPHVFPGMYSVGPPGSIPYTVPPPGGEAYPPTSVGLQRLSIPPPLHRRVDVTAATTVPLVMERGEGDGQRSMTPQTEKTPRSSGSQLHPRGVDIKATSVTAPLQMVEPQQGDRASPVVQAVIIGGTTGEVVEPTTLANGNTKEDSVTKHFQGGASGEAVSAHATPCSNVVDWEMEEGEYSDPDWRRGRLYYRQSYKSGGGRGQEDRGGFRGGGFRGRRDHSGRSRQHNQFNHHRVYRGRGRGRGYTQQSNGREMGYTGGQYAHSDET